MHNCCMQDVMNKDAAASADGGWLDQFIADETLPSAAREDIVTHFRPLVGWLKKRGEVQKPYVLGINGPQGSGKSTLARYLQRALQQDGLQVPLLALDDFYLSHQRRMQLAEDVHPLLAVRGVPGTHDIDTLQHCLSCLLERRKSDEVSWPSFDKSVDERSAESNSFTGRADVILFEGWCVATPPETPVQLESPLNALEAEQDADGRWRRHVDQRLRTDYAAVFSLIHGLCYLSVPNFDAVRQWRTEQEHKLIARTGKGMSDAQVASFILHFERLTRTAMRELPTRADCLLEFDADHRCVRSRVPPSER